MKIHIQSAFGSLCVALCLAQPASAQIERSAVGEVNASIDGASYVGETLEVPSEGTSTAEFRSFGPVTSLTIQAHDPEAESVMSNVLSLEISLMGTDPSASIMETSASWWPDGMGEPFYHSEGSQTGVDITLDTLSLEDGEPTIAGSFSALLCRKESFFAEADKNDCLPVEASFDTILQKAD